MDRGLVGAGAILGESHFERVLAVDAGRLRPNTAIFLAEDFERPYQELGAEIATIVRDHGSGLSDCPPNVRNFLGGIMGMNQGLHAILRGLGLTQLAATREPRST